MDDIKKLLILDITGPFAHFRKYYTNASSLSYGIPPRTVIAGLIAGILGNERNTYYNVLGPEKSYIAIRSLFPFRKIIQKVNYIDSSDWKICGDPHQVNLEILVPINNRDLGYRVYFSHKDKEILENLKKRIEEKKYIYNPYLGITEFLADINFVDYIENNITKKNSNKEEFIEIATAINYEYLVDIVFSEKKHLIKEIMPVNFKENNNNINFRELNKFSTFIYELNGEKFKVKLKNNINYYCIEYKNENELLNENIVFME